MGPGGNSQPAGPDRSEAIEERNGTQAKYLRDGCIHQLTATQAARAPDAVAIVDGSRRITYRELDRRANRLANYLRGLGVGHETLVGICLERSLELVLAQLAVLKAGGAYVPVDPAYPAARITFMLSDTQAPVVLTREHLTTQLPTFAGRVVRLDRDAARIRSVPAVAPEDRARPDDLAYVMYTSGSTGQPKGICVPHRAVVRLVCDTNYVHFNPADQVANASNSSFDAATFEIWGALLNGARLFVVPQEVVISPPDLAAFLRQQAITILFVTTALFRMLAAHTANVFAPVHLVLVGGDRLDPRWPRLVLEAGPPRRLLNVYGPTENTTFSCWHPICALAPDATTVPIGRPVANTAVYLLDDKRQPVPVGVPGEIYLGGDGLARGYLNLPALTAERFIQHPFSNAPGARLFRTGDVGKYLPDGTIDFLGRLDHQVKVRGFRVEPDEIETVLNQHPGVRESVVVTDEDSAGDRSLIAYVVPERKSMAMAERRQVTHWQELYDKIIYRGLADAPAAGGDPTFNISGWVSSYTGEPIGPEPMHEQVSRTVHRILALRPDRVLEIGCGTGLLLFRLAPQCSHYLGTDFSSAALDYLRGRLSDADPTVRLSNRLADDFSGIEPASFDTVVLNSVIQHFPSPEYLMQVLAGAVTTVRPGGAVFIGDVRSLAAAEAFYSSVELQRAPPWLPTERLRRTVQGRVLREQELLVDPRFFDGLPHRLPGVRAVTVQLKRGRHHNELTRFRYDVVLHVGSGSAPAAPIRWTEWHQGMALEELELVLRRVRGAIGVSAVPNARVLEAVTAARLLAEQPGLGTAATLQEEVRRQTAGRGVDPEDFWDLGERAACTVEIGWSASGGSAAFDVVCYRGAVEATRPMARSISTSPGVSMFANEPLISTGSHELIPELRRQLRERLPEYMVPTTFVVLERLPLTPNGKVDRAALPPPSAEQTMDRAYLAPRTGIERKVAAIWERVLGVPRVGVHDNFFDLGGTSLKVAQVVTELRCTFLAEVPVLRLFERPTVRSLADSLSADASRNDPVASLRRDRDRGAARRARKRERLPDQRVESGNG